MDLITFVSLARVLKPSDFGLIAIVMAVVVLAEAISELPTSVALIIHRNPPDDMLATAFTLSIIRAGIVAILLYAAGVVLSQIYGDSRLFLISCVLTLAPVIRGLVSPRFAVLAQQFKFRPQFVADVASKFVAMTASVSVAVVTESFWAIAVGTVVAPLVVVILSYCFAPYRPRLSLHSWPAFSGLMGWNSLAQVLTAINWQVDRLVLPRYIDTTQLGKYVTASEIAALPFKAIAQPLAIPLLAGFSAEHSVSKRALFAAYLRALDIVMTVMLPILAVLAIFAEPLVIMLVGEKWREAAPIVTALCVMQVLAVPRLLFSSLCFVLACPKFIPLVAFIELVLKLPLVLILVPSFGIKGALVAHGVGILVAWIASSFIVRNVSSISLSSQFIVIMRPLAGVALMYFTASLLLWQLQERAIQLPSLLELAVVSGSAVAMYFLVTWLLWTFANRPDGLFTILEAYGRSKRKSC